jgi:DNA-binding beta-propeller fold protein YncE
VANFGSRTVTPIRTATNTALPAIKIRGYPAAIAISPDGKTAYVASDGDIRSGWVTPIRIASNTALRPIKLDGLPVAILIAR